MKERARSREGEEESRDDAGVDDINVIIVVSTHTRCLHCIKITSTHHSVLSTNEKFKILLGLTQTILCTVHHATSLSVAVQQ